MSRTWLRFKKIYMHSPYAFPRFRVRYRMFVIVLSFFFPTTAAVSLNLQWLLN